MENERGLYVPDDTGLEGSGFDRDGLGASRRGDEISRRTFLTRGAGAAGGAALLGATGGFRTASLRSLLTPEKPVKGGRLRLALSGTSSGYVLDALGSEVGGEIIVAHRALVYDTLTWRDQKGNVIPYLATEFSSNKNATVWKMKLREGVEWHDGSPFTSADVVSTFQYILNPSTASSAYGILSAFMTSAGVRALDKYTVELTFAQPYALLQQTLSSYNGLFMTKTGYNFTNNPQIGTGPFKLESFVQGQSALLSRNPHYWQGAPYLDEIELILIADADSRLAALQAGQVDAVSQIDLAQLGIIEADSKLKVLRAHGANWVAQAMHCDTPPFSNNNVRLAFKYMQNRQEIIKYAVAGQGRVANDMPNSFDVYAATDAQIPQRPFDPDKATYLLKQAGFNNNLAVTLATTNANVGELQSAEIIAQLGQKIGANIGLNQVPAAVYSTTTWLQSPFSCTFRGARSINDWISNAMWANAPQNETRWNVPSFTALWMKGQQTLNDQARAEIFLELQKTIYDRGGYMIWGFLDNVDAYVSNLKGLQTGLYRDFNFYNFNTAYFA